MQRKKQKKWVAEIEEDKQKQTKQKQQKEKKKKEKQTTTATKGNKKAVKINKIPTVGNGVGAGSLEIRTGNCSESITLRAPLQPFCCVRAIEPKAAKLHWVSMCRPKACVQACQTKIRSKNINISRLWWVQIGNRVDGAIAVRGIIIFHTVIIQLS